MSIDWRASRAEDNRRRIESHMKAARARSDIGALRSACHWDDWYESEGMGRPYGTARDEFLRPSHAQALSEVLMAYRPFLGRRRLYHRGIPPQLH